MAANNKQRGIEIITQPGEGISSASRGMRIDTQGKPINLRVEKQWGYVYLVIDCSGSMGGYKLGQAKTGIMDFAKSAIQRDYLVGLIKFDSKATHLCEPMCDTASLERHLGEMMPSGSTNMAAALEMADKHLAQYKGSLVIVVATDGQPDNVQSSIRAGQIAKDHGIDIITIGTDDADKGFLKRLASRTDLGTKVSRDMLGKAIAQASNLLPSPRKHEP